MQEAVGAVAVEHRGVHPVAQADGDRGGGRVVFVGAVVKKAAADLLGAAAERFDQVVDAGGGKQGAVVSGIQADEAPVSYTHLDSGAEKRAVPLVGRTWLVPAQ